MKNCRLNTQQLHQALEKAILFRSTYRVMGRLPQLFQDLLNRKQHYLGSTRGSDFEDRIDAKLYNLGYSRIIREDIEQNDVFDALKKKILMKTEIGFMKKPYGSQEYPDFLVLEGDIAIGIEVKFSSKNNGKPIWNSGLPRPNGIYIFGSYGRIDITFFRGVNIVSVEDAKNLHGFFHQMKEHELEFNTNKMQDQTYGYSAYIRKAFAQSRQYNLSSTLDFFCNPRRLKLEKSVLNILP